MYHDSAELTEATLRGFHRVQVTRQTGTCWIWTGSIDRNGYGQIMTRTDGVRQAIGAHRAAYIIQVGTIPDGLVIDHLCRNRACVNPDHLEPVTNAENIRRGRRGDLRVACVNGHEYTPETLVITSAGRKRCRICAKRHKNNYRARLRAEAAAA